MTREEFEEKRVEVQGENTFVKKRPAPSDSEYKEIEFVYMFYPTIDPCIGKKQIAYLYEIHGMSIIRDMMYRAKRMKDKDDALRIAKQRVQEIQSDIEMLAAGVEE